ncbi:hypothetical protein ACOTB6_14435 [Achromobacter xylosoxidans]
MPNIQFLTVADAARAAGERFDQLVHNAVVSAIEGLSDEEYKQAFHPSMKDEALKLVA